MNRILTLFFGALTMIALVTGCQTAEGFGEDVENAGDEIEDAVD